MKEDYNRRKVDYHHIHATSKLHFDIFFEVLNISENQNVIDVGGGYGEILLELKKRHPNLNYYYDLLEPSNLQLNKGKEKILNELGSDILQKYIRFTEADLMSFTEENKYDHVIFKMVLHEFSLENKKNALKKAKLLLKENGILTIWRPYLPSHIRDFFSAVILKKDELAGFNIMQKTRYFDSEEQFNALLIEAEIKPVEPVFIFEYLFDTHRRFESELHGNKALYKEWLDFIQDKYHNETTALKNQVKLIIGNSGIYINFQRAIYQYK